LLLGFWFFCDGDTSTLRRRIVLGTTALTAGFLAGPNTVAPAVVLWLYGVLRAWRASEDAGTTRSRVALVFPPVAAGVIPAVVGLLLYLHFNLLRFGDVIAFGYERAGSVPTFGLHVRQAALAISAYLASPSLSVFLFAPPLLLHFR
jgi:hypothetical protein